CGNCGRCRRRTTLRCSCRRNGPRGRRSRPELGRCRRRGRRPTPGRRPLPNPVRTRPRSGPRGVRGGGRPWWPGVLCVAVTRTGSPRSRVFDDTSPPRRTSAVQSNDGRLRRVGERLPASEDSGVPQCTYGAGKLLCAVPGLVLALDPADGRTVWRHDVAPGSTRSEPPVLSGGLLQPSLDRIGDLEALDPATGEPVWQQDTPAYDGVRAVGDTLLLTRADGMVTGVDSASGETRWSHRIPGQAVPYFTSFNEESERPSAYATSPSADGSGTRVTAVDPATGDVRWDAELEGALTPVGAADGHVYLVADGVVHGDAGAVVRFTPGTGDSRRVPLPVPVPQAAAGVHGDTVYLMGAGGSLAAVDMAGGKQRWRLETGVSRGSVPVSDGRHVYVTAPDGRLLGVDARKGRLLGQTRPRLGPESDRVPGTLAEPVLAGDHVYAGAPDGTVFGVPGSDPAAW
ncbi:LOW QUALITY PROTEIN: serine/threonine protein kinase, partial [Streptomyces griseoflavus Tu4000]